MELFPDGGFVRLRSRAASRKCVHADGDWEGVSLRPLGSSAASSLESVWRVQHYPVNDDITLLQLQSAAYGRCLSYTPRRAHPGHHGRLVVQVDGGTPANNALDAYYWRWRVERVDPDQGYIDIRLCYADFHLRANGKLRRWNTGVSADLNRRRHGPSAMMQWTVHGVAATHVPIPLPDAPPQQPQHIQGGRRGLLFWRRTGVQLLQPHPTRTIRHVRASDDGVFVQNHHNWALFDSNEHSVFNLRNDLGLLQADWNGDMLGFTLCMRPGSHGRLIPLVTDLPRSSDSVNIVVFRTGSPAAAALVYPQIDPPAQ